MCPTSLHTDAEMTDTFGALFDMDVVGLAQTDLVSGRMVRVNRGLATLMGCTPEELIGRSFMELSHPDEAPGNWDGLLPLVRGEMPALQFERRLMHRDGHGVWTLMAAGLLCDARGAAKCSVAVIMDLQALKQTEERLACSERRLKLALHAAELCTWHWQLSSGDMVCADETVALLGVASADLRTISDFHRALHCEDAAAIQVWEDATQAGGLFHADYRVVGTDGHVRWIALHAAAECDLEGKAQCVVGTLSDITERKCAEAWLRQAHERLETRVHEHADRLEVANERLRKEVSERRDRERQVRGLFLQLAHAEEGERSRLAREVHDAMGQHVTALTIGLKSLFDQPALPLSLRERVHSMIASARQLDQDMDTLAYRLHPTVLVDLGLEDALRELVRMWSQSSEVVVDFHASGLRGHRFPFALETTLYRAVQEALTNVRKHAVAQRVSLIVTYRAGQLKAIVEDDGRGFPVDKLKAGTTHMGLRSMLERARQAGGSFDIESSPGQGTSVYIAIPAEVRRN